MSDRRACICAALRSGGGQELETLAAGVLRAVEASPGDDPRIIAYRSGLHILARARGLGLDVRDDEIRATVADGVITVLWDDDPAEFDWNIFIGIARAVLARRGTRSTQPDVYRLAAHFAIGRSSTPRPLRVPAWVANAYRRGASTDQGSGVWPAVIHRGFDIADATRKSD